MKQRQTSIHLVENSRELSDHAKTGVSLHCHTKHSKEMLDFVPHYAEKLPIIASFWRNESKKYIEREGHPMNFDSAFWSPPLPENTVYQSEKLQIENAGLNAIVSITDHDAISANLAIDEISSENVPISLEWTVPFEYGFFHLGVHNLPKNLASDLRDTLLEFTFNKASEPNKERLHQLFSMLEELPGVLIVLNHPLWDIEMAGQKRHKILLDSFIAEYGGWIHALELNGFRYWSENKRVIEMAETLGFPVVTGGDRHGCMANTVINVTNSDSFEEFANEVRIEKRSEVVLLPEYRLPVHSRQLKSFSEILSNYPEFEKERRQWFDRTFFDLKDGKGMTSLSDHGWRNGGPRWLRVAIGVLSFLGSPICRPIFDLAQSKEDRVPKSFGTERFALPEVKTTNVSIRQDQKTAESGLAS